MVHDELTKRIQESRDNHPIRSITINGQKIGPPHVGVDMIEIEIRGENGPHKMAFESPAILEVIYTGIRNRSRLYHDPRGLKKEFLPNIVPLDTWAFKNSRISNELYIEFVRCLCYMYASKFVVVGDHIYDQIISAQKETGVEKNFVFIKADIDNRVLAVLSDDHALSHRPTTISDIIHYYRSGQYLSQSK